MRKGEELKAPRYASAAASCNDHVTIYNIIPNISLLTFKITIKSNRLIKLILQLFIN